MTTGLRVCLKVQQIPIQVRRDVRKYEKYHLELSKMFKKTHTGVCHKAPYENE